MPPVTSIRIITLVICTLAGLAGVCVVTLCICALRGIQPNPVVTTALISLSGTLSGALSSLLVNTRTKPEDSSPVVPIPVAVQNTKEDPVHTEEIH